MSITITPAALDCFRSEWGYREGDSVRIFVRYSGGSDDAFAFGIMKDLPMYPAHSSTEGGITFFMEQNDAWYLDGRRLTIDCSGDTIRFERQ